MYLVRQIKSCFVECLVSRIKENTSELIMYIQENGYFALFEGS